MGLHLIIDLEHIDETVLEVLLVDLAIEVLVQYAVDLVPGQSSLLDPVLDAFEHLALPVKRVLSLSHLGCVRQAEHVPE